MHSQPTHTRMKKKVDATQQSQQDAPTNSRPPQVSPFVILKPYKGIISVLVLIAVSMNVLTLSIPKMVSNAIDTFIAGTFNSTQTILVFGAVLFGILVLGYLQSIVQTVASERVGRDIRNNLADKISRQTFAYIHSVTPAKLLTNITSDIDSIKLLVAQAVASIVASLITIFGASVILISIDWKLALAVLTILPLIGGTFFIVLKKVRVLFVKTREIIDALNRVINESILGAPLVRIVFSQQREFNKFVDENTNAKNLGIQIVKLFSAMIPIITFVASMATVVILALGGHYVIGGTMSLGDFAAFNSYLSTLIFPIFVIGFISNVIAQASASYGRVEQVISSEVHEPTGTKVEPLTGDVVLKNVQLTYGVKPVLQDVSIRIPGGKKTAIIGPTAAGKTQLLNAMIGLIQPDSGEILYNDIPIAEYSHAVFYEQVGLVFQDSVLFNLSIRENIAFRDDISDEALERAIEAAELKDFIAAQPDGLNTVVSERGTSLSGGQKQRIMLARALAINPNILLLDDFTARVDRQTEKKILQNIERLYPDITIVSVTQKIASVEAYDQVILLMEGEVIGAGTHHELLETLPEYMQIYESQQSMNAYE